MLPFHGRLTIRLPPLGALQQTLDTLQRHSPESPLTPKLENPSIGHNLANSLISERGVYYYDEAKILKRPKLSDKRAGEVRKEREGEQCAADSTFLNEVILTII